MLTTTLPYRMATFNTTAMRKDPGDFGITANTYIPDTKNERLKWLEIALRAQGLGGQQALITIDEHINCAYRVVSDQPVLEHDALETLNDLLARRDSLRKNLTRQANYLAKDITYDIWSLIFRMVLDLVRTDAPVDLLAQPATLLRASLDFAAVNKSWRRYVLHDAALWSFLPVHLGHVLQNDPYEHSQIKMYLDRIGDRIPVHVCARGWTHDDDACTAALRDVFPFLRAGRQSARGPNIKELTIVGIIDENGTGTLKHLPVVFHPLVPALSGLSLLNSSSGIMHALSLPGVPGPTNLRVLTIDLHGTEDWQDDWHFPALFRAIGSSVHSFRLRTNGTPTSLTSDRRPPTQTDIFVTLTELDICLDDIGGCLTGLLFGYHQFIGLQRLTLITHGHWADIGFSWARAGIANWIRPKYLTIVAWVPQNTDPGDKLGFEWVSSAIGDMDSVETLELRGVTGVNSHIQRFLDGLHTKTSTGLPNTCFRNLKQLVLCDVSFDAVSLAEFVETQRRRASSLDGYAHFIRVVFRGECEGLKAVFDLKRPQELAYSPPDSISNELPALEGGVNIPIRFLADDGYDD